MNEQSDHGEDFDGWPMPSRDVIRELERPALSWYEDDSATQPNRPLATA
jgi:hypothetical protein